MVGILYAGGFIMVKVNWTSRFRNKIVDTADMVECETADDIMLEIGRMYSSVEFDKLVNEPDRVELMLTLFDDYEEYNIYFDPTERTAVIDTLTGD